MYKYGLIFIFFYSILGKLFCQNIFIDKYSIKKNKLHSIKNLFATPGYTCTSNNEDSCAHIYTFTQGRLSSEIWFNNYIEKNENKSLNFNYSYIDTTRLKLDYRWGNLEAGIAQQHYFKKYTYKNNNLSYVLCGYNYNSPDKSGTEITEITKFFYYPNGHLNYQIDYNLNQLSSGFNSTFSEKFIDSLLKNKQTIEYSRKYYIYENKRLVGYFPAKNYSEIIQSPPDSIYLEHKLQELNKIGWSAFKTKYLNGKMLNKVIADCYLPVKKEQLLIDENNASIYLLKTGLKTTGNVVIEIADNYFLFYSIIN